ncbi:ROK family protein [Paenibacillus hunanensis]|uniref:Glucokinase n=1 Tax=Paenibacillus hunanensis TaxID=539262 RepID=A0ABU1IZG3_9BACL|nr:ROK family protein [Paenibacillus hunanensis]MCL9660808.1 ROK family protein [Paenibacillus hunanensis]MDR6244102.1 glucokinase [Paenibacillus hunanensis]WPP41067.1 ROK family protein [Paenibacillus hunanensis]GGJ14678.1 glucokinase [Paenibacillus hunanensis]
MQSCWIGIDIGGTAIKGALVNEHGQMIERMELPTRAEQGAEYILGRVLYIANELKSIVYDNVKRSFITVHGIGIGSAGRIDRETGAVLEATDNLPGWKGLRLAEKVSEATGLPVYAVNDAHAAAAGEDWIGAARTIQSWIMLTIGTGIGGALVHYGEIISGQYGGAGELGHMILHPGGLPCNCGKRGCVEQYVSGTALNRLAREYHPDWTSRSLLEAAKRGDTGAHYLLDNWLNDLANTIINLDQIFDPQAIIIGGGIIVTRETWWTRLIQRIDELGGYPVRLEPAMLGNQAGMVGAARIAMQRHALLFG